MPRRAHGSLTALMLPMVARRRPAAAIRPCSSRSLTALVLAIAALATLSSARAAWRPVDAELSDGRIRAMGIAPSQTDVVYVSTTTLGFYRTDDAGMTWIDLADRLPAVQTIHAIAVSPGSANVVLLGALGVIYRSTDRGVRWFSHIEGLNGGTVRILAFDPLDASVVFAAVSGSSGGVYRSSDGGRTWTWLTAAFGDLEIYDFALDPSAPERIVASFADAHLRSIDGGDSWQLLNTGVDLSQIAWSSADPDLVWASGFDAFNESVYRSTDGGLSFSPRTRPSLAYGLHSLAGDPLDSNRVILTSLIPCGIGDGGAVWQSTNQGASWTLVFSSGDCSDHPADIQFDPADLSRVYHSTMGHGGFWVSDDSGSSWDLRNDGIHSYEVHFVRSDGAGHLYARGYQMRLIATDPFGSWTNEPPTYWSEATSFEVNRGVSGLLFECGTAFRSDVGEPFASASDDHGATWLPPVGQLPAGFDGYPLLFASSWNDHTAYLFGSDGIYRSEDASQSYELVSPLDDFVCAAVDPVDDEHLFAGQNANPIIMHSTDAGSTWAPRDTGLPLGPPVRIEFDPLDSNHLMVAIAGAGAFETSNAGQSWSPLLAYAGHVSDAAWDSEGGFVYLATDDDGVVSNDPGVSDYGLPRHRVDTIAYDAPTRSLLAGTTNGLYVTRLLEASEVGDGALPLPSMLSVRVAPVPARESVTIHLRQGEGSSGASNHLAASRIDIVDVNGRIVRQLYEGAIPAQMRLSWDTRDAEGKPAPAGLYWVRAIVAGTLSSQRVLLLR